MVSHKHGVVILAIRVHIPSCQRYLHGCIAANDSGLQELLMLTAVRQSGCDALHSNIPKRGLDGPRLPVWLRGQGRLSLSVLQESRQLSKRWEVEGQSQGQVAGSQMQLLQETTEVKT